MFGHRRADNSRVEWERMRATLRRTKRHMTRCGSVLELALATRLPRQQQSAECCRSRRSRSEGDAGLSAPAVNTAALADQGPPGRAEDSALELLAVGNSLRSIARRSPPSGLGHQLSARANDHRDEIQRSTLRHLPHTRAD